jgi:hypothetical protein
MFNIQAKTVNGETPLKLAIDKDNNFYLTSAEKKESYTKTIQFLKDKEAK